MIAALLVSLALGAALPCDTVTVARVIDGDTFVTSDSVRVRLIGVDAPELRRGNKRSRARGERARAWLDSTITGRRVVLEMDSAGWFDRFCRRLAYVRLGERDINTELIRRGLATPLLKYPFDRLDTYRDLTQAQK